MWQRSLAKAPQPDPGILLGPQSYGEAQRKGLVNYAWNLLILLAEKLA